LISITRDNASSNDTLISAFKRHYDIEGFNFEGDIPCLAHVLNLVVQDILKAIIKDDYDSNTQDIYRVENEEDNNEEVSSKFIY
jgi:hypothetical protein